MSAAQPGLFVSIPREKKERSAHTRRQVREARSIQATLSKMRALHEELNQAVYAEKPAITSAADVYSLVQYELENLDHEELFVVVLDRRNRVIQIVRLYVGSVSSSQVRIGEVFRPAIMQNASAIIPIHNHPSGDPTPSPDDVAVTRAMVQAGRLLDIEVLDHIVIGKGRFCSLKERGLGFA